MKIRITNLLLLFLTFFASANDVMTRTVSRPDGSHISYYLFQHSHNSDSLLLILQGSDCNSILKIDSIFSDYKNIWPEADMLLIEKYGIDNKLKYSTDVARKDCPTKYLEKDSPYQRLADIKVILDLIRKGGQYKKFILLGGSEGAVIANLVTSEVDYIDATISFSGGGRWFMDDILYNIALVNKKAEETKESIDSFKGFAEFVLNSKPVSLDVSGHGYHWWYQMLSIDQLELLQKVSSPLLIVQGGRDISVSPKKTDNMVRRLKELGKSNIDYQQYEALDHQLKNIEEKSPNKEVISDMNTWLRSKLGNPR